ncbi:MAG: SAF domain-containing protein [Nocardioidaceae bacterium]|nr:SAF domain-containing protein [Nocardioidaceae bacterium]
MAKNRPAPGNRSAAQQPTRLPSTRERRPALAALAVLLIVGGALASGWLALRAGDRVEFLQVRDEIAQGQQVQADDLEVVRLPRSFGDGVSADDRGQVVGRVATTRLVPGTVLNPQMYRDGGGVAEGTAQVTVPVASAAASDLTSGTAVAMTVPSADGARPQIVLGEVARLLTTDSSGGIASNDSEVLLLVGIDVQCLGTVAPGLSDGDIQVVRIDKADSTALASACGS